MSKLCQLLPSSPHRLCPSAPAIWLSSPAIFYSKDLIIKAKNMFKTMHQHLHYALWSHSPQLFTVHEHESPFFSILNHTLSVPLPSVVIKPNLLKTLSEMSGVVSEIFCQLLHFYISEGQVRFYNEDNIQKETKCNYDKGKKETFMVKP